MGLTNIINPKNEYWIRLEEAPHYELSNFGRVRSWYWRSSQEKNPKSKRIKNLFDFKENKCINFQTGRQGERCSLSVAKLVYKYFGVGYPQNIECKVKHLDGDYKNNNIENLFIVAKENAVLEKWQEYKFNQYGEETINKIVDTNRGYYKRVDIDDLKQMALIRLWQSMWKLEENEPLGNLARRCIKYAYYNLIGQERVQLSGSEYPYRKLRREKIKNDNTL